MIPHGNKIIPINTDSNVAFFIFTIHESTNLKREGKIGSRMFVLKDKIRIRFL